MYNRSHNNRTKVKKDLGVKISIAFMMIFMILRVFISPDGKTALVFCIVEALMWLSIVSFVLFAGFSYKMNGTNNIKEKAKSVISILIIGLITMFMTFIGVKDIVNVIKDTSQDTKATVLVSYDLIKRSSLKGLYHSYKIEGMTLDGEKVTFKVSRSTYSRLSYKNGEQLRIEYWENSEAVYEIG